MTIKVALRILKEKDIDGNILGVLLSEKYEDSPHGPVNTFEIIESPENIFRIDPNPGSIDHKYHYIIPNVFDHPNTEYKGSFSNLTENTILFALSGIVIPTPENPLPTLKLVISKTRTETLKKESIDVVGLNTIIPPLADGGPDIQKLESLLAPEQNRPFLRSRLITTDDTSYILAATTAQTQDEAALVLLTNDPDIGNFVLADTGPYLFFARENGSSPQDRNMCDGPDGAKGLYLFSKGKVWTSGSTSHFEGDYDDGVDGIWEKIDITDDRIKQFGINNDEESVTRLMSDQIGPEYPLDKKTVEALCAGHDYTHDPAH